MKSILVIAETGDTSRRIRSALGVEYNIDAAHGKEAGFNALRKIHYDLAFVDFQFLQSTANIKDTLDALKAIRPALEIIVMIAKDQIREAVHAVKLGAGDYLTYPLHTDEIRHVTETIHNTVLRLSELDYLRNEFWRADALDIVQTRSGGMKIVFDKIRSVAPTRTTVLLIGETGTGKSLLAKLIHRHSNRKDAQFIEVHCGAIPDTLLESELFGHEKGAFTGAVRKRLGKFEIAKNGTIFLDEIGTVTPAAQVKLLQVLQDGTFSHVGGEMPLHTDARVIAATNSDLKKMTEENLFRRDLYYRLNVFPIEVPPLRERTEDLPFLIDGFVKKLNREFQKNIVGIHPHVLDALKNYAWPGNIRELENLIERAYILETASMLNPESFPRELFGDDLPMVPIPIYAASNLADARRKAIEDFERQYLKDLLVRNRGKINKSADDAGISTRQLHKLLIRYGIQKEDFKA